MPTIDVATQDSGPRLSLRQLAEYLEQQAQQAQQRQQQQQGTPPRRLLNVVSLSLAGTRLEVGRRCSATCIPCFCTGSGTAAPTFRAARQPNAPCPPHAAQEAMSPPDGVAQLNLVAAAWPAGGPGQGQETQRPETLLYALLGGWGVDAGGPAAPPVRAAVIPMWRARRCGKNRWNVQRPPLTGLLLLPPPAAGPAGVYTDWHVDMGGSAGGQWFAAWCWLRSLLPAPICGPLCSPTN